ncbi:shikimate dehydrogenase [Schaalia sp. lx-100]|uniref:shikimate dehydrogenase n=1 Tax=Schaalia sp. lx-100 TaxID=2899081 RepID=UPI001E2E7CF0|nr:shikimate dehydrogenase [Schaalia sp. lx-100]MCD4557402.1 shikimate dehydrogenase [Schaalia sp. lx-100]
MPWAAVIGSPIEHSLSPVLHRAAWEHTPIGSQGWDYRRIECDAQGLASLITGLDEHCRGLSVTMPCKQAIIPFLDVIDPLAQAVGSVNTLIPSGGVLTGFNTDVFGIERALHSVIPVGTHPRTAVILGSGATACSALAAVGTLGIHDIYVVARRFAGPNSVVVAASRLGITIHQILWNDDLQVIRALSMADIVVSTVPAHVCDSLAPHLADTHGRILLDVVYAPMTTDLVAAWRHGGGLIAHGLDMLIFQAIQQVRLMTGYDVHYEVMRHALEHHRETATHAE